MTSKFTREELLNIIETDHVQCGEASALARMALAAMDSEPVAYADPQAFDNFKSNGGKNAACTKEWMWRDHSAGLIPLYRHAQPAPVAPKSISVREAISALESADAVTTIGQAYKMGWNHCRAAMLQENKKSAGASNNCRSSENVQVMQDVSRCSTKAAPALYSPTKTAESRGGNSPVIPDGLIAAVNRLLDSDGSRGCYSAIQCGDAHDEIERLLAAAPHDTPALNSVQSVVTVPGKWIPVSERMPENDGAYLCWDKRYVTTYAFIFGAWQANQFIAKNITHWMPLPAAPQEVKGE